MFPTITDETLDSTLVSIQHTDEFTKETMKNMKENNPVLYSLLEIIVNSDKDISFVRGFLSGATQFYILGQRQIEADELERLWG
jgi:hypothetical protein